MQSAERAPEKSSFYDLNCVIEAFSTVQYFVSANGCFHYFRVWLDQGVVNTSLVGLH